MQQVTVFVSEYYLSKQRTPLMQH